MTAAGSQLDDAEIIDYMLTGLGKTYNPIAASLSVITTPVTSAEFYSMVLNYEALQLSQQSEDGDWSSSANAASQYGFPSGNRPRAPDMRTSGGRPAGGYPQQGQGYPQGGYSHGGYPQPGYGGQGSQYYGG